MRDASCIAVRRGRPRVRARVLMAGRPPHPTEQVRNPGQRAETGPRNEAGEPLAGERSNL